MRKAFGDCARGSGLSLAFGNRIDGVFEFASIFTGTDIIADDVQSLHPCFALIPSHVRCGSAVKSKLRQYQAFSMKLCDVTSVTSRSRTSDVRAISNPGFSPSQIRRSALKIGTLQRHATTTAKSKTRSLHDSWTIFRGRTILWSLLWRCGSSPRSGHFELGSFFG